MTDTSAPAPAWSAGDIVGEAFSVYFRRLFGLSLLALVPYVAFGLPSAIATTRAALDGYFAPPPSVFLEVPRALAYVLASGLLARGAYEVDRGRSVRALEIVAETLGQAIPLFVCSVVVGIAVSIGMVALLVPGFWIMAVWAGVVPAVVVERVGFQAFRRSAELTRGVRREIVGALVALGILAFLPWLCLVFVSVPSVIETAGPALWALVVQSASAIGIGVVLTGFGVIYGHLRALEEGRRDSAGASA